MKKIHGLLLIGTMSASLLGATLLGNKKAEHVCADGHTHDTITFSEWTSNNSLPSSGSYYLTKDVTISSTWQPGNGTRLCLNGFGIKLSGTGNVIRVSGGGALYIYDCNTTSIHKYKVNTSTGLATVNDSYENDYETFTGGYITGGNGVSTGGAIYLPGGPSNGNTTQLYMYGGTIIGNSTTGNGGGINYTYTKQRNSIIELSNVTIMHNVADDMAGGIFHHANNRRMNFTNTKVLKNVSANRPAGVVEQSAFNISGDSYIFENRLKNGSPSDANVYHASQTSNRLTITGALSENAKFGIESIKNNRIYNYFAYNNGNINEVFISQQNQIFKRDGNDVTYNTVTATGYEGTYDGQPHKISLSVSDTSYVTGIKYGLSENVYDLDENPSFSEIGTHTVYYKVSADSNAHTGSASVIISDNDKDDLLDVINDATSYFDSVKVDYPEITKDLESAIEAANSVYEQSELTVDEINAAVKDLVDVVEKTKTDIAAFNKDLGENVYNLIDAIESPVSYPSSKTAIEEAREAYNALFNDTQRGYVTNLDALEGYEAEYATLRDSAINEVISKINAIPEELVFDAAFDEAVSAALNAYNNLDQDDKNESVITNLTKLLEALEVYNQHYADEVKALINQIGSVEYSDASHNKIVAAREAYDSLSEDQKALVDNYQTLTHDEGVYNHVDAAAKAIDGIGEVSYSKESKESIDNAKQAYESLTEEEKALISGHRDTLLKAVETYEALAKKHNSGTALAVIFGILGGLILLVVGAWALLLFVFNKWIKEGDKAVRVFPFALGKKDGKERYFAFPCKFAYRAKEEVFKTKEEALK